MSKVKQAAIKATEGPWEARHSGTGDADVITWVKGKTEPFRCTIARRVSWKDAVLIAAAPELKQMLSLAVCYVDNEEVKNQIYRLLGKIDGIGDTFHAKAEGR